MFEGIKGIISDVSGTIVLNGVKPGELRPATPCLADTLRTASDSGIRLFAVSELPESVVRSDLVRAGIDERLFRVPNAMEGWPTEIRTMGRRIMAHIEASSRGSLIADGISKIDKMLIALIGMGYDEGFIEAAISGERRIRSVVSIGDGNVERAAAEILGITHYDLRELGKEPNAQSTSSVIRRVAGLPLENLGYESPKWLAARRPVSGTRSIMLTTESGLLRLPQLKPR